MSSLKGKQYQKNARKIDQKRMDDLKRYIAEYGDLSGIILNLENNEYVGGNQRSKVMQEAGKLVDLVQLDAPDGVGTVAYGFVEYQGNRFAYREVRWDEIRHAKASIIANNAGGENDLDLLIQHHAEILDDVGLTERDLDEIGSKQNFVLPDEQEEKPVFEILPKFSEKHNAVVIVIDNELDENFLKQVLGLEAQQSYKNTNVGTSFVITAQQFIRAWNKSQS